ncbi:MAG: ECF-type sigma factor [Proteobacteria bacterium]|nr:ECF-type sigma factor [Pseudomonadota bacterium]
MKKQSITVLLSKLKAGENHLLDDIYTQLYTEIKAIALNQINQLKTGETITPTVIANECYIKLAKKNNIDLNNKRHFLNYLAKSMRLLLIDIIRAKSSDKRKYLTTTKSYSLIVGEQNIDFNLLEVDLLLTKIEKINIQYSEILEYKLIFNLTFKEISELLGKSERQVIRIWKQASTLIMVLSKESRINEQQNRDMETRQ